MKKISAFLIATFLLSSISMLRAQNEFQSNRHELQVGIGIFSTGNIIFGFADAFAEGISQTYYEGAHFELKDRTASPTYHIGYKYLITNRLTLGGILTFGTEHSSGYLGDAKDGDLSRIISSFGVEANFYWINSRVVKLYSGAGAGALYFKQNYKMLDTGKTESQSNAGFDFQVTPLGARIGNNFGVFAEVGFGYKGIISAGLFARL